MPHLSPYFMCLLHLEEHVSGHPRNSLTVLWASRRASRCKNCKFLRLSQCLGMRKSSVTPFRGLISVSRSAPAPLVWMGVEQEKRREIHCHPSVGQEFTLPGNPSLQGIPLESSSSHRDVGEEMRCPWASCGLVPLSCSR